MFNTIRASVPKSKTIHGYEIKRMPLGAYLEALDMIKTAPAELLEILFPGQSASAAIAAMKRVTDDDILAMFGRFMAAVPRMAFEMIGKLTGIPSERLLNDPNIGLNGLMDICKAFLEVNEVENFLRGVPPVVERLKKAFQGRTPGCSA